MREKHVDDVSRTHTYIHTYIQKYSDFLVYTISVGLAQARPNYADFRLICRHAEGSIRRLKQVRICMHKSAYADFIRRLKQVRICRHKSAYACISVRMQTLYADLSMSERT